MFMKRIFFCIILFSFGCSSSKKMSADNTVIRQLPKFDYAVQRTAGVGSSDITIALVNPVYVDKDAAYSLSPFNEMAKSMGNDFEELLTAKGFKIRGPFAGMGSMLFTDKKNSDFILTIDIDFNIQGTSTPTSHKKVDWGAAISGVSAATFTYSFAGKGSMGGTLNITAMSPSFGEKLWKKSIALARVPLDYAGSLRWTNIDVTIYDHLAKDPVVYNIFVQQLEKMYKETFDLVTAQIDVEEMKSVAAEAKKAEKKN
jgi:hypothetical protein